MTGSISDVPPGGPSVSPDVTLDTILQLITQGATTYNTDLTTYNTQKASYLSALSVAQSAFNDCSDAYNAWVANPTSANEATKNDKIAAFSAALTALRPELDAWTAISSTLLTDSTTYVNYLAYQQIYWAQDSGSNINGALTSILGQPLPSTTGAGANLPVFPWLTTDQLNALSANASDLNSTQTALLDNFKVYRNDQYLVAKNRNDAVYWGAQFSYDSLAASLAYFQGDTAGYNTYFAAAQTDSENATNAANAQDTATTDAATAYGNLTSTITSYETTLGNIQDLSVTQTGGTTINALKQFCSNWTTNVIQPAQDAALAALTQMATAFNAADVEQQTAYLKQFGIEGPEYYSGTRMQTVLNQFNAVQAALISGGVNLSPQATAPELPPSATGISMTELMNILGQIQIMNAQLIRDAAQSEHVINNLRLQFAISHLLLYVDEIASLNSWSIKLTQAQDNYNAYIDLQNSQIYNDAIDTYNFYQKNIPLINDVINSVNAQITAENTRIQALVDGSNSITPAVIDAIFSEQTSLPETQNYLLNYIAAQQGMTPGIPSPITFDNPIPLLPLVTSSDFMAPPYTTYPGTKALDQTLIDNFNTSITAFVEKIAPVQDLIIAAIQKATDTQQPLELSTLVFHTTTTITDTQMKIGLFLSAFETLYGYLSQTILNSISSEGQQITTKDLQDQLVQLLSLVSGGTLMTSGNTLASAGAVGAALFQVVNSNLFKKLIDDIFTRAAMLAGLNVAGTLPDILKQLSDLNTTLAALLEAESEKTGAEVDAQTVKDIINALIQQLSLTVSTSGPLQQNAIDLLKQFPSLASLSNEDLMKLISGVIIAQQMVVMLLTTFLAIIQGLSPGQIQQMFTSGASTADIVSRLISLGIPKTVAIELAGMIAGQDQLETVLSDLGFDPTTRTILMALIAAAQGGIPLTDGAPGGPAFLDILLTALKDKGITLTQDINSPDFLKELVSQLGIHATAAQQSVLNTILAGAPPITPTVAPTVTSLPPTINDQFAQAQQSVWNQLNALFNPPQPPPVAPTTTVQPSAEAVTPVLPSAVLNQYVAAYQALAPDIQQELLTQAATAPALAGVTGLTDEQKAALMLGLRLGVLSPIEAGALVYFVGLEAQLTAQNAVFKLSELQNQLVAHLFTPTPEEIRVREDQLRRQINAPYTNPTSLPPQVLEQISLAFRKFFNDLSDQNQSQQAYATFAQTIRRLSDFNYVALNFLLDPAMIILRQLSPFTRTGQDRYQQPKITVTG